MKRAARAESVVAIARSVWKPAVRRRARGERGEPPPWDRMAWLRNGLLDVLQPQERQRLESLCRPVELHLGEVLQARDRPGRYVFFPTGAIVSLVAEVEAATAEVAMVGVEGMVGVEWVLGVERAPWKAHVQRSGWALRMPAAEFAGELSRSDTLRLALSRYAYVVIRQMGTALVCLQAHQTTPRLARWLLMMQDRAQATGFFATQEALAGMLGVRRAGITLAAGELRDRGCIQYARGVVTVVDRAALRAVSCACYSADRQVYSRVLTRR